MSVNIANPIVPVLPVDAVGLEKAIEPIRINLSGLTWLSRAFGRARIIKEDANVDQSQEVPKVYMGNGEYFNVMPGNDNLTSYCFFVGKGQAVPTDDSAENAGVITWVKEVDLIFWMNVKEIDLSRDSDKTSIYELQVENILRASGVIIIGKWNEKAVDVFSDFDIVSINQDKLEWPWGGFRFRFSLTYNEALCIESPVPLTGGFPYTFPFTLP